MPIRTLIWLRYFWPALPALLAALGVGWMFGDLGVMWSLVVPAVAGVGVFVVFTWVQIATSVGGPR